jgi:DNA polymerase-3 subunit epsilon
LESYDWAFNAYRDGVVFTAFDIETTGLDPKKDKIAEIGAVKFDKRGPICRFSTLINPGIPMPVEAGRVNNITDAMLADKPSLKAVLPDFLALVKNTVIVAYNASFDCGFINEALVSYGPPFQALPNRIADALLIARRLFPDRGGFKLQDLASALGIRAVDAHRAEDDARICMEIFIRCYQQRA